LFLYDYIIKFCTHNETYIPTTTQCNSLAISESATVIYTHILPISSIKLGVVTISDT